MSDCAHCKKPLDGVQSTTVFPNSEPGEPYWLFVHDRCLEGFFDRTPPADEPAGEDLPYAGHDEHPEKYDGPCGCDLCLSYGAQDEGIVYD